MTGENERAENLLEYDEILLLPYIRSPKILTYEDLETIAAVMHRVSLMHKITIGYDDERKKLKEIVGKEERDGIALERAITLAHHTYNHQKESEDGEYYYEKYLKLKRILSAKVELAGMEATLNAAKRAIQTGCERHPDIESEQGQKYLKYRQALEEMII